MKLKRIYEYQGFQSDLLDARGAARCPSCCPPASPGGSEWACTGVEPYAVSIGGASPMHSADGIVLWRLDASDGYLYSHRISDGVQLSSINLPATLGRLPPTYSGPIRMGADGIRLFIDGSSSTAAGQCALIIVNTITGSITTFGVYPPSTYSGAYFITINPHNTIWVTKGTVIAALDQTTLIESFVLSTTRVSMQEMVYVSALDEVWVSVYGSYEFDIYDAATGAFITNTTASIVGQGHGMNYDSDSGLLIVSGGTGGVEVWDTVTRTITGTLIPVSPYIYNDGMYIPGTGKIVAYKYIDIPYTEIYVFIDAVTMEEIEVFDPVLITSGATHAQDMLYVVDRCNIMLQFRDDDNFYGPRTLYRVSK